MTSFTQAAKKADSVQPVYLKTSELAFTKQAVCMTVWEKVSSEYKGETNEQYKAHVVYIIDGKKQSGNIFLPANEWFDTLLSQLDGTQHNLYVYKQGNAYRLAQYEKEGCPCGHQQEVVQEQRIDEMHYDVNGNEVHTTRFVKQQQPPEEGSLFDTLSNKPGSITAKQMKAISLLEVALGVSEHTDEQLEAMSEQEAEKEILALRRKQVNGNG